MAGASQSSRISAPELVKRILVGRAMATSRLEHTLLPKILALPVFASDPLSSVAYATEEMMLVLALAGAAALSFKLPLAVAVAVLLVIVVTSYRQTVRAYPRGGGSYIVARENLGTAPGLVAAAAILTDYVLTVAVSITAGTVAIVSAVPAWAGHRVAIAIGLVGFVTIANLRGVKEAGTLFAIPTYGFVAVVALTLITGFGRCLVGGCPEAATSTLELEPVSGVTLFLLARAFSSGATALTGVEAIADGVQAFRRPQAHNAATTLAVMATMSVSMFLGITLLAEFLHVRVTEEIAHTSSVLSQIGRTVFGDGVRFYALQVFTALILILAANTAFQDFPRLSAILARDGFMPSQFRNRGDRLVFSNGVVILAGSAALLIWHFDASLTALIQLYVVGVFTAFTLSQAGMVRRWTRIRNPGWQRSAVINGIGATTTGIVLLIVTITKWTGGARFVVYAIPVVVAVFLALRRHYRNVAARLHAARLLGTEEMRNMFVPLVPDLGPETLHAIAYLRSVRPERCHPLYTGPRDGYAEVRHGWSLAAPRLGDLEDASEIGLRGLRRRLRHLGGGERSFVTVVVAERVRGGLASHIVRGRHAFALKTSLLFEPGVVVTDVPLPEGQGADPGRPLEPARTVSIVPISGVHDATVRALIYAKSLNAAVVEAVHMQTDPEDTPALVRDWWRRRIDVPLVLVEASFRDLGPPLLELIRGHTARGDTVVNVVLPEVVPQHWWEQLLHAQTPLYFKRLLLFEPGVVLTSVPFHLRDLESIVLEREAAEV
jgi:amino acid transporter